MRPELEKPAHHGVRACDARQRGIDRHGFDVRARTDRPQDDIPGFGQVGRTGCVSNYATWPNAVQSAPEKGHLQPGEVGDVVG